MRAQSRTPDAQTPVFQVISGSPSDDELAALAVVLLAAAASAAGQQPPAPSGWRDSVRRHLPLPGRGWEPGPGAWRASAAAVVRTRP